MIFIYLMTVLIAGAWIIQFILHDRKKNSIGIFPWIVLFFLTAQILSTIFSIDKHTSLFGYYGRFNGGLLSIISYCILFFIFVKEGSIEFVKTLLKVSLASSLVVILWGLPARFGFDLSCGIFTPNHDFSTSCWTDQFRPEERMFSTIGQPNWLGAYMAIHFFIGVYFYIKNGLIRSSLVHSIFLGIYLLLAFSVVLFTRSRSALLAVTSGIALFPFLLMFLKNKELFFSLLKKYSILLVLLIIPLLLFKTGIEKVDKFISFTSSVESNSSKEPTESVTPVNTNVTESFDIRKVVWKGAWQLALQNPLFGTGVETFAYAYYFTRPVEHNNTSEWDFLYNKAHNEFVHYLATTGFIGLTAYLAMIGAVIVLFIKKAAFESVLQLTKEEQYDYKVLLICLLIAYYSILVTNFFGFSTTTINLFFYWIPAVILISRLKNESLEVRSKLSVKHRLALALTGATTITAIFLVITYWIADVKYTDAQNSIQSGQYSKGAYDLINVLKYHYEHVYEDKASIAIVGTALSSVDKEEVRKLMLLSEYYNQKALQASPYNVLYWKSRGTIFYNFYQIESNKEFLEKAIDALKAAEKLAPTDPRVPYTHAQYAAALYDAEKENKSTFAEATLKEINKSIALKPDYYEALLFKAQFLKKIDKKEEALKLFKYLQKLDPESEDIKQSIKELE